MFWFLIGLLFYTAIGVAMVAGGIEVGSIHYWLILILVMLYHIIGYIEGRLKER